MDKKKKELYDLAWKEAFNSMMAENPYIEFKNLANNVAILWINKEMNSKSITVNFQGGH